MPCFLIGMSWYEQVRMAHHRALGRLAPRQVHPWTAPQPTVRLIALLTALMGMVNVVSGLLPTLNRRFVWLEIYSPLLVRHGGHLASVLAGFALLLLANGLWRHKQTAWLLTLIILLFSAAAHMVKGLDYEEATLALLLALYLWTQRSHFHALSDSPSRRQGLLALAASIVFTAVYGTLGFYLLDRHFHTAFNLWTALLQTGIMVTQFYDPGLQPVTAFGRYFAGSIYLVGGVTLGYSLWMLLRPMVLRHPASAAERQRAARIVQQYGASSVARFALLPDKSYFFSSGGSVVAFAVNSRVALALGDPIGPPGDLADALAAFRGHCRRNDWQPAFYQVLPDHLDAYRDQQFDLLCIGQEAIVDLTTFSLAGRTNKSLRSSVNRLERSGYQAILHQPPLDDALLEELRGVSDAWLTQMHGREKGYSMGWFEDEYVRHSPVMAIHAPGGAPDSTPDSTIVAFANLVAEYQRDEVGVDLMRHRPDAPPGVMDFLFVSLLEQSRALGYATFNLGLSALYLGDQPAGPRLEQALHYIYEHVDQLYNFKGLHTFKQKFHPTWSPRYLAYPGPAALPRVVWALSELNAGEALVNDVWHEVRRFARRNSWRRLDEAAQSQDGAHDRV